MITRSISNGLCQDSEEFWVNWVSPYTTVFTIIMQPTAAPQEAWWHWGEWYVVWWGGPLIVLWGHSNPLCYLYHLLVTGCSAVCLPHQATTPPIQQIEYHQNCKWILLDVVYYCRRLDLFYITSSLLLAVYMSLLVYWEVANLSYSIVVKILFTLLYGGGLECC